MGHEHNSFVVEELLDAVLEDVVLGVVIHCREGGVQKHDIGIRVGSAGDVDALALAAGQVNTTEPSLALITIGKDLEVQLQGASVHNVVVLLRLILLAKEDVFAAGDVLQPGHLAHVGH